MWSNRPLFATRADSRFHVLTSEMLRFEEAVRRGRNALVVGERGSGKTSLLHMVELQVRQDGRPVCFVSLAQAQDAGSAAVALAQAAQQAGWISQDADILDGVRDPTNPFGPNAVLAELDRAPADSTFLVDDVSAGVGHALFGRLRDELWQLPPTWGVATDTADASGLLTPPADAFFEQRVDLRPLEPEARRKLLESRSATGDALPEAGIAWLAEHGPGNPRHLVSYARQVVEESADPRDLTRGVEARRRDAEAVGGRAAADLVSALDDTGPASAGDPELLKLLGWTRPRASELLGKLEQAGIVRSYLEPRSGPGRPRKLYELCPPAEFLG